YWTNSVSRGVVPDVPANPPVTAGAPGPTQPPGVPEPIKEPQVNERDGLRIVWIPAGTFLMGCSPDDECPGEDSYGGLHDEGHGFPVTLTKGYWMQETTVTVGAYKRYVSQTHGEMPREPYSTYSFNPGWEDDLQPMLNVTWGEAKSY